MNVQLLIDAIVRQTTVLIAQLATSGGLRAPLSDIAGQVFLQLAEELSEQGVSRKVSADMFGMALRTYRRKLTRLREGEERGQSLWQAVLDFMSKGGLVTRRELVERFGEDEEGILAAVLRDLTDSGLLFASGTGDGTAYRRAEEHEIEAMQAGSGAHGLEDMLWVLIYRNGPLTRDELTRHHDPAKVEAELTRLLTSGRVREETQGDRTVLTAGEFAVPIGASHGWEAAVFDHYQALVQTICQRLATLGKPNGRTGGSTYTLDVWPGHPHEAEALEWLARMRETTGDVRAKIEAYNARNPGPEELLHVVVYAGQCVLEEEGRSGTTASPALEGDES